MAIESKAQLKTYFETGDTPTQQQFENLIDSVVHVDELSSEFEISPKDIVDYPLFASAGKIYQNVDAIGEVNGGQVTKFSVWCSVAENLTIVQFSDNLDGTGTIINETAYPVVVGLNEIPLNYTGLTASVLIGFKTESANVGYKTPAFTNASNTMNLNGTGFGARDHEFAYWLTYEAPGSELPETINVATGNYVINSPIDLQNYIDNNSLINIPSGVTNLTSAITVPSGKTIIGSKNSMITMPLGQDGMILNGSDISIKGVKFDGGGAVSAGSSPLLTDAQIAALTGIGAQIALKITGTSSHRNVIHDCSFTNIRGKALQVNADHVGYRGNVRASDLHFEACQVGLVCEVLTEYNNFTNIGANNCWVGIANFGGNNLFSNCNLSGNGIGALIGTGSNNSHSSMVGSNMNHSFTWGIWYNGDKGFVFSGCHFHDSDVRLYDCQGFNFVGGQVGGEFHMEDSIAAKISNNIASNNLAYNPFGVVETAGTNSWVFKDNTNFDGTAVADVTIP